MRNICFVRILFVWVLVFSSAFTVFASEKADGYYKGQAELSNFKMQIPGTLSVENSRFTYLLEKKINYAMGETEVPVGVEMNIQGALNEKGAVTGDVHGIGYVGVGEDSATWSFTSELIGELVNNTLHISFHVTPQVTKCPNESAAKVTCSADPFDVSANYTRLDSIADNPDPTYAAAAQGESVDSSVPTISKVMGDVEIINPDTRNKYGVWEMTKDFVMGTLGYKSSGETGAWGEGKKGMELPVNSQVKTGSGRAVIEFADGTKFVIREYSSFRVFNGGFELERGAFHMTFVKQANGQIVLKDKRAIFGIRGTQLLVEIGDEQTTLTVFEGLVDASPKDATTKKEVSGGQSVLIRQGTITDFNAQNIQILTDEWSAIEKETRTAVYSAKKSFVLPTVVLGFVLGGVLVLGMVVMFKNRFAGVVLIILSVGFGSYLMGVTNRAEPVTITPTPTDILASNTPTPTVGWKTYINTQMGFTIQHPEEVKPETYNDGTFILSQWGPTQKEDTEFFDGITISIAKKQLMGKTLAEVVEENRLGSEEIAGEKITPPQPVLLGGIPCLTYKAMNNDYYFISLSGDWYLEVLNLSADPGRRGYKETAAQILETLRIN